MAEPDRATQQPSASADSEATVESGSAPGSRSDDSESGQTFLRELARVSDGSIDRASQSAPPIPTAFGGTARFAVEEKLGNGGFGEVYRAFDRALGVRVALKVLARPDPRWLYRFKLEFRALGHLVHPNLVTRYELINDAGHWFFTMELVEGQDLLAYVRPGGKLDQERLRAALRQLAEGLQVLHDAGMVHRDIKPSNVLVDAAGRVVLLDFGLVADYDPRASMEQEKAGTPKYMSPEQALGERAGPASDWYTMGAVLHEVLTGVVPRAEGAKAELLKDAPPDLAKLTKELLWRDPRLRLPGGEVLRILGAGRARPSAEPAEKAPFVGRAGELAVLHEAARAAAAKRGPVWASITGESGIGKTALLDRAVEELRARNPSALVLRGRCYERETVPFKALDGVMDALGKHLRSLPFLAADELMPPGMPALAQLFPSVARTKEMNELTAASGQAGEDRLRRAASALRELLQRLAEHKLVVFAVDDLQWGDADSAGLLGEVLAGPSAPPILMMEAHRDSDEQNPVLRKLEDLRDRTPEAGHAEIALGPLPPEEAQKLARGLARTAGLSTVESIAREARGNPFFVVELAQQRDKGARRSLDAALLPRIAEQPPAARALLDVVSIAAAPLATEVALAAAGPASSDPAALAALRAARLVRRRSAPGAGALEAYHDRIREAVVRSLPEQALRERHAALAAALEAAPARDHERLSHHFAQGGNPERAAFHAALGADQAVRSLAFDRAVRLYREALRLGSHDAAARSALQARLGDALAGAGRGAEAAEAYEAARQGASPLESAALLRKVAEQLVRAGRIAEGLQQTRAALDAVGLDLPRAAPAVFASYARARLGLRFRGYKHDTHKAADVPAASLLRLDTAFLCSVNLAVLDPLRGQLVHARDLQLALEAGEPSRLARSLAAEAFVAAGRAGTEGRVLALLQHARSLAVQVQDPELDGTIRSFEAGVAYAQGRLRDCVSLGADAEQRFLEGRLGTLLEAALLRFFRLGALFYTGDWPELLRLLAAHEREYERRGDLFKLSVSAAQTGFLPHVLADDAVALRGMIKALEDLQPKLGLPLTHSSVELPRAWEALWLGDAAGAQKELQRLWPRLRASGVMGMAMFATRVLQLRASVALLAASQARRGSLRKKWLLAGLGREAARLQKRGLPVSFALASLVRAGAAVVADAPDAVARLEAAEKLLVAQELLPFADAAKRVRGTLVGGEAGRALVAEADEAFKRRGAKAPAKMSALLFAASR